MGRIPAVDCPEWTQPCRSSAAFRCHLLSQGAADRGGPVSDKGPDNIEMEHVMNHIQSGYRGFALLVGMNLDRLMWLGAISIALVGASYMGAG